MTAHAKDAAFWSKISRKYAASPVRDMAGYLTTLERTKSYLSPRDHILEIGCGTGSTALLLAPHVAQMTATDLSPGMIEIAEEKRLQEGVANVSFEVAEVQDHEPEAKTYDAVLAHNLLHLLPELDASLAHIASRTKNGGYFISKTVCAPPRLGVKFALIRWLAIPLMQMIGKAPFVNFLTVQALERKIEDAGFEIVETADQSGVMFSRYIVARKI